MSWWRIWIGLGLVGVVVVGAGAQELPKQITFGEKRDVDPMVSPDGKYLVFASNRTGTYNLFLANLNEEKAGFTQLTQGKKDDRYPSWRADGKRLVFMSKRTGNGDLYETAPDGSAGFLQLTEREDREEYPSYSPKSGAILFARGEKKLVQLRPRMDVVLLEEKNSVGVVLAEGDEPRFSSDGSRVVFVSRRTKNNDIWVMTANGERQTQLTTEPKDDENPAFSPDGKYIVFASNRTGNFDIWVMDADGGNQRQITTGPEDETEPCWSVGGYIYYSRRVSEGQSNIYRIKAL